MSEFPSMTVQQAIETGLEYAKVPASEDETRLATALYDELSDMCQGRGLSHQGGAFGDSGRSTVVVCGSVDLIALARRALHFADNHRGQPVERGVHPRGSMVSSASKHFACVSDACADAWVTSNDKNEHPFVNVALELRQGIFEVQLERDEDYPSYLKRICIHARDRGDGEIAILAASLRWIADRLILAPGYYDLNDLNEEEPTPPASNP